MSEKPQQNTGADFVFCFWSYNDIDHMVPVIYKLSQRHDPGRILCVIFNLANDFHDDYRIRFLTAIGVRIVHICHICGIKQAQLERFFSRSSESPANMLKKITLAFSYRLYWKKFQQRMEHCLAAISPAHFLQNTFGNKTGILITDHQINPHYEQLVHHARHRGHLTVAVPHGPGIGTACRSRNWNFSDDHNAKNKPAAQLPHDMVLYANEVQARQCRNRGLSSKDHSLTLGSARFCSEWLEKHQDILPAVPLPELPEETLKIVLMATKPQGRVFKEELDRIISYVTDFPDTFLIIKSHTRGERYRFGRKDNIRIVENDIPSSSLIDWSDLTLFTHSSIVLENIQQDKPVLYLKRVVQGKMIHEQIIQTWRVECQEELYDFLCRAKRKDKSMRSYSRDERQQCIATFIEPCGTDVLANYADFFVHQLQQVK